MKKPAGLKRIGQWLCVGAWLCGTACLGAEEPIPSSVAVTPAFLKTKEKPAAPVIPVDSEIEAQLPHIDPQIARILRKIDYNRPETEFAARNEVFRHMLRQTVDAKSLAVLKQLQFCPVVVEIDASYIAFPRQEFEATMRSAGNVSPTQGEILKAWAAGKGRLLSTSKVVTMSGQQAKVEGISEVLNPSGYAPPDSRFSIRTSRREVHAAETKDDAKTETNEEAKEGEKSLKKAGPDLSPPQNTVTTCTYECRNSNRFAVPTDFAVRNLGTTLNVTPQLERDGKTISLNLAPEYSDADWSPVAPVAGKTAPGAGVELDLPGFQSRRTRIGLMVSDGETIVAGGGPNKAGDENAFLLLTTRLIQLWPEIQPDAAGSAGDASAETTESSATAGAATKEAPSKLWRRNYHPRPHTFQIQQPDGSKSTPTTPARTASDEEVKKFFADIGVSFPPGSSVAYNEQFNLLSVVNTSPNLDSIANILEGFEDFPGQADITCAFIGLSRKVVEDLMRQSGGVSLTQEQVKQAWTSGQGKLLSSIKMVSVSGQQSKVEHVREVQYPAEPRSLQGAVIIGRTESVVETGGKDDKGGLRTETETFKSTTRLPDHNDRGFSALSGFESHNLGTILNVNSNVGADGHTLSLTLVPEFSNHEFTTVEVKTSDGKHPAKLTYRYPVFHCHRMTTSLRMMAGTTLVLGGVSTANSDEVVYILITPRLLRLGL